MAEEEDVCPKSCDGKHHWKIRHDRWRMTRDKIVCALCDKVAVKKREAEDDV